MRKNAFNARADVSKRDRGLNCGPSPRLYPNYVNKQ